MNWLQLWKLKSILCIVETWLNSDISNSEIMISGYQLFWKDRDRHGGGVLIFVRACFLVKVLCDYDNLELLTSVYILSHANFTIRDTLL